MAKPHVSEDEVDDLIYFARTGDDEEITVALTAITEREKISPADVLAVTRNEAKSTALHMASANGHTGTVRMLLRYFDSSPKEMKQQYLDDVNEAGNTALHWAALSGHLETVALLLDQGASPAIANEHNYVPMDEANLRDKTDVAQYFLTFSQEAQERKKQEEKNLEGAVGAVELNGGEPEEGDEEEEHMEASKS